MADEEEIDPRKRLFDAMRRRARHVEELAKLAALRDDELDRTNRWWEDVSHGELREIERLNAEIEAWAREHRTDRVKSWKTPFGTVSTRENSKGRVVIDDEADLLAWCEENGYLRPPAAPKPDIDAIRKQFTEIYDIDGVARIVLATDRETDEPLTVLPGVYVEGIGEITVTVGGDS